MTLPPPAPAVKARFTRRRPRRGTVHIASVVLAAVLLVLPAVYLFEGLWSATGQSAQAVATQRAALAYARPLSGLLAALVDAQHSAARGTAIDETAIRARIDEINRVDRGSAIQLGIEQRWAQLTNEIDRTISLNARGPGAARVYGAPVALVLAMLDWLADSAEAARDPATPHHLIGVALHQLPDVVAAAGDVAALAITTEAGPTATENSRLLTIAQDRVARISAEIGVALRAGASSSGHAADLQLLRSLDEFAAAADELNQAAAELNGSATSLDRVEMTSARVKTAAVALEATTLNAFEAHLAAKAASNTTRQRTLVLAGVVMALTAGGMLWRLTRPPAPADTVVPDDAAGGRHGQRDRAEQAGADPAEHPGHLVDARELIARESTHAGRVVGARKR